MKELLLSFIFALIVGSVINGCSQAPQSAQNPGGDSSQPAATGIAQGSSQVLESSDKTFEDDVLKSDQPVLVEFGAKWCQPCKQMAPILDQVAAENAGKLKVVHVDVDENKQLSEQYAQGGLPTFVIFKGGQTKKMQVGLIAKPDLDQIIKPFTS